ncbi:MAG: Gfo/Idh/MocA family oxidoreductase [Deltaproteobacteria bacterium]|nr:Gfo/Idh/MocA family oxidoreductase [Deltaproteobacteria bacterium]
MKKVRVAVIGAGYLGRFHAQKYSELEDAVLTGVVDTVMERAERVAKETNSTPYTSCEELIGKVDCVSIVTPTESHYGLGMSFLKKGIDVLIEKPMATTPDEAELLIKEAKKTGATLQIGHLERFNPAVIALAGKVKNPLFIEAHRLSPFPDRSLDVDVVLDMMIHDIDIILNLVPSEVAAVDAVGIPVISDKVDIANVRMSFKNGCVANVTASRISKEKLRRIRLFQSDSYISIDYALQEISIAKLARGKDPSKPSIIEEKIEIEKRDSLKEEIKSFLECSALKKSPLVTGEDGKRALEVAHRIQASVRDSMEKIRLQTVGVTALKGADVSA